MFEGGLISEFLDAIQQRLTALYNSTLGSIFGEVIRIEWTVILVAFVFVMILIAYFLPFKWVRAGLGFIVLLGIAFYAGGMRMYSDLTPLLKKKK